MTTKHSEIEALPETDLPGYPELQPLRERIMWLANSKLLFSDVVIHQDSPIMLKQPRRVVAVSDEPVSRAHIETLFGDVEQDWQKQIEERAFDRAKDFEEVRIRLNCFSFGGKKRLGSVIRRFPAEPVSLNDIGLKQNCQDFAKLQHGLVLVIGDTSQGKSTTLAALLDQYNKTRGGHILTFEDPVEGLIPNRKCIVTQREVGIGRDVTSYFLGAQDALRERPDVVLIGEIRDAETAREALALAEAGPLVFCTIHAKNTELGLLKMLRLLGNTPEQAQALSTALKGTICQALLPSVSGARWHLATECMTMTPDIARLIEGRKFSDIRAVLERSPNSHSMNKELYDLYKENVITYDDAKRATTDQEKFKFIFGASPGAKAA